MHGAVVINYPKFVNVEKAGTLSSLLSDTEKQSVTLLQVTGNLNGSDIVVLQEMANANLKTLDMSGANIVTGGSIYYTWTSSSYTQKYSTKKNVIGAYMFYKTTSLERVSLPESATTIEGGAFGYGSLKRMEIGSKVTSITAGLCAGTALDEIILKNNSSFVLDNGILYDKGKNTVYKVLRTVEGDITLPYSITKIENSSFEECNLRSIVIPSKVTKIDTGTFGDCPNLEEVTFPTGLTDLGYDCFGGCKKLKKIDLSNTKTTKIYMSFYNCSALEEVSLPSTLKEITGSSFTSAVLKKIICNAATPPVLEDGTYKSFQYDYIKYNCKVYVPKGRVNVYKAATGWKRFTYIYEIGTDIDEESKTSDFNGYNGRTWMIGSYAPIRYDFADINAAMASSQVKDGDILLLDRYQIMNGNQTVNKSVKIVGSGYLWDHWIEGDLNIEAPNATVDGIDCRNINVRDENARIEHCDANNIVGGYNYECDGAVINSNNVGYSIDAGGAENWTITNNYVKGKFSGTLSEYSQYPTDMPYFSEYSLPLNANANSTVSLKYIIANVSSINYMEYFWDTDPGWTKATALKNANNNYVTNAWNSPMQISTSGLSAGQHTLVTRARSASGYWVTGVNTINIQSSAVVTDPKPVFSLFTFPASGVNNDYRISFSVAAEGGLIDWVEYYWDTDPGQKKGHIIVDQGHDSGGGISRSDYLVDCGDLTGKHTLYVRAFCGKEWAQVYVKEINLKAPGVVDNAINANDLAALKLISDNLGLNGYWNFANDGKKESDFPGVTFLNHRVIEIDLSNHAFTGMLSESWMPSLPEITLLNLSRNNIYGDITPLVAKMPKLKTLDVSHNRITQVSGELPASLTSFNARSQMRTFANSSSGANEKFLDLLSSGTMPPTTAPIGAQVTIPLPTLFYYDADKNDNSLRADIQVVDLKNPSTIYGTYTYNGTNKGWKFTPQLDTYMTFENEKLVGLVTTGKWQQWSACPALFSVLLGDANIDGMVDVLDVQHTLNYILATAQPFNYWAANTYVDKIINVQDIVCTVNIMLGLPNNARSGNFARSLERDANRPDTDIQCWVYEQNGRIALVSAADVAALDIEVDGVSTDEVSLMLSHRDFQMIGQNTATGSRYVIFSPTGATLPAAKSASVLALSRSAIPVAVRCADAKARELGATISQPTGIREVHSGSDGTTIIETNLAPGIYIVRTIDADGNSKTVKILKK